jgi:hypothetical protein
MSVNWLGHNKTKYQLIYKGLKQQMSANRRGPSDTAKGQLTDKVLRQQKYKDSLSPRPTYNP